MHDCHHILDVFVEVGGARGRGKRGRRSFVGLEEGDELGGEAAGEGGLGVRKPAANFHPSSPLPGERGRNGWGSLSRRMRVT
jgi:hypothetical protein